MPIPQIVSRRVVQAVRADTVFRRLVGNSAWMLGTEGITAGFAFLQSILLVRLLGVEQYGVWVIIATCVSTAYQLMSFRIEEFVVKYLTDALTDKRPERKAAVVGVAYLSAGASGLLAFALAWIAAPLAAQWLTKEIRLAPLFQLYTWSLLAGLGADVSIGVLQVSGQFRTITLLQALKDLALLGGFGIVVWLDGGLSELIVAVVIGTLVYGLAVHVVTWYRAGRRIGVPWGYLPLRALRNDWRAMGKFLLSTNFSATISLLTKDSDNLWLGYFRSPTEVGYYKLAYSLAHLAMMPVRALIQPTYREIARILAQRELASVKYLLKKCSALSIAWIIPASASAALLGPFLIKSFYGTELLPAVPALMILLVGVAFANIFYWSRSVLLALGLPGFLMKVSVVVGTLKLALVFVVVPSFGYLGSAALLSGLYLVGVGLCLLRIFRDLRVGVTMQADMNPALGGIRTEQQL